MGKYLFLLIVCIFLIGCTAEDSKDESLEPPDFDLTGTWDGSMTGFPDSEYFTIDITQSGNSIEGYYINDNFDEMTVSGTVAGDNITIILRGIEYPDYRATCVGTFTEFFADGDWSDTEGYYGYWDAERN